MPNNISTKYNHREVEKRIYQYWKDIDAFSASLPPDEDSSRSISSMEKTVKRPFVISIPPPNVTGRLHMGHALNNTIQDILIRYKRMDGYDALWIPGTDHAGIATQTVVKKMLDAKGIDYRQLGRKAFIEKIWEWKEKYGNLILKQLERLGASCDWKRTRFTMDKGLSKAVNHAFKKLYDDGLIYRGLRIVNWCPIDQTALSDDEIETKEGGEAGFLWHIKYPIQNSEKFLVAATTRPETLFGDVALAVHPKDSRYQRHIGKKVILPILKREIPIIADECVDRDFGSGCVKITPAHDPNDFEIGSRHGLTTINIMEVDARLNENCGENYRGLTREEARKKVIEELNQCNLLVKEEARMIPVGRSYRSKAIIEYRLSQQWFVKMDVLKNKVLQKHFDSTFIPSSWEKVYLHWLNNIRDWCVSRQIWWGHRIPAWYHQKTGKVLVEEETPEIVKLHPEEWEQEKDVLDTWFSSALWPMSILGWPKKLSSFNHYFPNSVLSTAKDIIFFWVARMNFMATYFEDTLPYKDVYIHPTVMDEWGESMSKSKGNGIDPLHIIEGATTNELKAPALEARPSNMKTLIKNIEKKYAGGFEGVGADALRYTLIHLCSSGQELKLSMDDFLGLGRRFTTKLWNASRFILMHIDVDRKVVVSSSFSTTEDTWIDIRIDQVTAEIRESLDAYNFKSICQIYYQLVWNDFCDWYIEIAKIRLQSKNPQVKKAVVIHLTKCFAKILKLIHPLMPFISEEIWDLLNKKAEHFNLWGNEFSYNQPLILSEFPKARKMNVEQKNIIEQFTLLQKIIISIRSLKNQYQVGNKELVNFKYRLINPSLKASFENKDTICRLAKVRGCEECQQKPSHFFSIAEPEYEIYLDLKDFVNIQSEKSRLEKQLKNTENDISLVTKKLTNENFLKKANPEKVEFEKKKLSDLKMKRELMNSHLEEIIEMMKI